MALSATKCRKAKDPDKSWDLKRAKLYPLMLWPQAIVLPMKSLEQKPWEAAKTDGTPEDPDSRYDFLYKYYIQDPDNEAQLCCFPCWAKNRSS